MSISVSRNEGWDATKGEPFPANRDREKKTLGYIPVFKGHDQSSRHLTLSATKQTDPPPFAGRIAMTPVGMDADGHRQSTCHHSFTLGSDATQKKKPHSIYGASSMPAQTPIGGGAYFVFDCNNQGSRDLLTSLYYTGRENRPQVRRGDPLLAELRLQTPVLEPAKARIPAWKRLFRDRYASLHISRRGVDMGLPTGRSLTQGQAQEIVLTSVAMVILSIEHDGVESKRWGWMLHNHMIGSPMPRGLTVRQGLTRQRSGLPFDTEDEEENRPADSRSWAGPAPSRAPSISSFSPTSAYSSPASSPQSAFPDLTGVHPYANPQGPENIFSRVRDIERDSILSSGTRSLRSVERHHVAGGLTLTKKSSLAISVTASIESVEWREGTRMVSPAAQQQQQQQLAVEELPEVDAHRKSPLDSLTV